MQAFFKQADTSGDNKVSFAEYMAAMANAPSEFHRFLFIFICTNSFLYMNMDLIWSRVLERLKVLLNSGY